MTRIFTDGAEFGDVLFWDINPSIYATAATKRSGNYSYYTRANIGGGKYIGNLTEFYFRFAVYLYPWTGIHCRFRNNTITIADIYYDNGTQLLSARVNGVAVGTSTFTLAISVWNLIEAHFKLDDINGIFDIKINGILDIEYDGDTNPGVYTDIDNIILGGPTNENVYYDDLALNDTNGSIDNSWCGDGHIELLSPNDNGDINDWDGSDGDSVNNYLLVDDFPHDTDTTYVKTGVTEQDMYNVSDFVATGKIVQRIYAECRAKDNAVAGGTIKLGYKHSGTVYLCADARSLSGSYARVVGDEALSDPTDSTVWSEADLDAIQFVVECSSSSSTSSSSSSTTTSSSSTTIP